MNPDGKMSPIVKGGLIFFGLIVCLMVYATLTPGSNPSAQPMYPGELLGTWWFVLTFIIICLVGFLRKRCLPLRETNPVLIRRLEIIEHVYRVIIGATLVIVAFAPISFFLLIPVYLAACSAIIDISFGHPHLMFSLLFLIFTVISIFTENPAKKGAGQYWYILYTILLTATLVYYSDSPTSCTIHF